VPYLRRYFLSSGNVSLEAKGECYEITFPMRIADALGEREAPIKLIKNGACIIEIKRELKDGAHQFSFRHQGKDFQIRSSSSGWEMREGTVLCLLIRSLSAWLPSYEVQLLQTEWDLPVVVAIVWAVHCPLELH
jgi:hypothetical protein